MKIVIAGGTGLIGHALAQRALSLNHDVTVLSRTSPTNSEVRTVSWDGKSVGPWVSELSGADVVVNLCGASIGEGRWTRARKQEIRASRIDPALCLIEAMAQSGSQPTYIQASAIGFYGADNKTVDEQSPAGDDYLAQLAIEWEAQADAYPGPVIIPRFGVVLATEGGAFPKMIMPFRLFLGGPLGDGQQWLSWCTLSDSIDALLFLIANSITGKVNVVTPHPVTNSELAQVIGHSLRRPAKLRTPTWLMNTLLGEQSVLLLAGQRVLPGRLTELGFQFKHADIDSALNHLLTETND